jgi:hypothetical protein
VIPHLMPADDARIRAEEEKVRRQLVAASEGGDGSEEKENIPVVNQNTFGRNDTVTIRLGDKTQTLKYKKAEPFIAEGWVIED